MVAQNDKYIPHRKTSVEDFLWLQEQDPCVLQLWVECIAVEGFGDTFRPLTTKLSEKSFRKAKKKLEDVLFEFKAVCKYSENNRLTIRGWEVRNLHGSKNKGYWLASTHKATDYSVPLLWNYLPEQGDYLPSVEDELPEQGDYLLDEEAVAFDTTAFDSSPILKKTNNNIHSGSAAVFSSLALEDSITTNPLPRQDLSNNPTSVSGQSLENPDNPVPASKPLCDSNPPTRPTQFSRQSALMTKSSAAPHVTLRQNTTDSHQKPPEAPQPSQTSIPTATDFIEALAPFSPDVDEPLTRLIYALEVQGRLSEFKDVLGLRSLINSAPTQVAVDAIDHVTEKLSSIKVLGAYMRKALTDTYKPSQGKTAMVTTNVSVEPPKPTPKSLEEFLSEENLKMFWEANLEGKYQQLCINQLFMEWDKGDELHTSRIKYWRGTQKSSRVEQ